MHRVPLEIVPDVDDRRLASVFVQLQVDGHPVRALLDSGAARSAVFDSADIQRRQVPGEGTGIFGVTADQQRAVLPVCFAGQQLGPLELDVIPADQSTCEALVGQDVLSRFRCEYRLAEGVLIVGGDSPEKVHPIHVGSRRHVYVTVTWPTGQTADAVIDTGASVTVVDERFAADHPSLFTHDSMSEGTDSSGTVMQTPMVQMAAARLLGAEFRASVAAVVDLSAANSTIERKMDLILGWPILSQGTFVIDHDLQLASYQPGAPSVS